MNAIRSPGARAFILLSGLLGIWLLAHPYTGIRHDGRIYLGLALAQLDPQTFLQDVFFQFGAQDRYTLFPAVYAQVITWLGVSWASKGLLIWAQLLFAVAAALLARRILSGPALWLGLAAAFALPAFYGAHTIFAYAESFVTARSFAEPVCLLAFAALLTGETLLTCAFLAVALALHPLIAFPAALACWLRFSLASRRWLWLAALVPLAFALAKLNITPFAGLLQSYDPAWLAVVGGNMDFLFMSGWGAADWARLIFDAGAVALAARFVDLETRRLLRAVLLAAILGIAATLVGADLLQNVLLTGIQPWRAAWPLHFFTLLLLPFLTLKLWKEVPGGRILAFSLISAYCCLRMGASPALLAAFLVLWLTRRKLATLPRRVERLLLAGLGLAALIGVADQASLLVTQHQILRDLDSRSLLEKIAFLPALLWLAYALIFAAREKRQWLAGFAAVALLGLGILGLDRRPDWTVRLEEQDWVSIPFAGQIPAGAQAYWREDIMMLWLALHRPSYYTQTQGSSAVFDRRLSLTIAERGRQLAALQAEEDACDAAGAGMTGCFIHKATLVQTCQAAPQLQYLILAHPAEVPALAEWRHVGAAGAPKTFYLHSCATILRQ